MMKNLVLPILVLLSATSNAEEHFLEKMENDLRSQWMNLKRLYPTTEVRVSLQSDRTHAEKMVLAYDAFQKAYDHYIVAKLDDSASRAVQVTSCRLNLLPEPSFLGRSSYRSLKRQGEELNNFVANYHNQKWRFGQNSDHIRIEAIKNVFFHTRSISRAIEGYYFPRLWRPSDPGDNMFYDALGKPGKFSSIFQSMLSLGLEPISPNGQTPQMDKMFQIFAKEAKDRDIEVVWTGQENQKFQTQNKTVKLLLHTHAHALYDFIALADLAGKNIGIIGNAYHTLPAPLVKLSKNSDHMVMVGSKEETEQAFQKIIRTVRRGKVAGFMVSTEAYTTTGMYDTRPNRKIVDEGLFPEIWKAGMKVEIHPVTIQNTYRLMNLDERSSIEPRLKTINAHRHAPISDSEVRALVTMSSVRGAFGVYLRQVWFEKLITNDSQFLSAPLYASQRQRMDRFTFLQPNSNTEKSCW